MSIRVLARGMSILGRLSWAHCHYVHPWVREPGMSIRGLARGMSLGPDVIFRRRSVRTDVG